MTTPKDLGVSRETFERLQVYVGLLRKWNPKINLISRDSLSDVWTRHIMDSIQVVNIAPKSCKTWADLGSGGGFPGLVIAILAMESKTLETVVLVESDQRKCAFLRTVIRETGVSARVVNARIEEIDELQVDVLSARALADLSLLLEFSERHLLPGGTAIFPKGITWEKELQTAQARWSFEYQVDKSITETGPVLLSITGVSRV